MRLRSGPFIPVNFNLISSGKSKRRGPVERPATFFGAYSLRLFVSGLDWLTDRIVDCRLRGLGPLQIVD